VTTKAYRAILSRSATVGVLAGALTVFLTVLLNQGCAGIKQQQTDTSAGGASATGGGATSGLGGSTGAGGMVIMPAGCNGPCTDFEPTANNPNPIFGPNVPTDVTGMFGSPSGNGPCVTEPEDGALFPNNWLSPRVHVPGYSSSGYLKITFHADMESTDLVAYAMGDSWALPKNVWQGLAQHIVNQQVTVTVQTPGGGATTVHFQIAPVGAGGSMVFWSMDPSQVGKMGVESMPQSAIVDDSKLLGFSVGDDSTVETLNIEQVQQQTSTQGGMTQGSHCIGCHVGTPDGNYVAYIDSWPWSAVFAGISPSNTGLPLTNNDYSGAVCTSWNTCTGNRTFMQYPWGGGLAFSPAHWPADGMMGERIAIMASQLAAADTVAPWNQDDKLPGNLVWIDTQSTAITMNNGQPWPTQGTAYGYMQHTGDLGGVAFPTWSNDGNTIVYASSAGGTGDQDGRLNQGTTDLYQVPYNDKAGGQATPVPGASLPSVEEYYPAFSPDSSLIAFTGVPMGQVMYANPMAQLYVVPFGPSSAAPLRLAANDPPSCTKMTSPGINNHWPKWAPDVETDANGNTYYWIIFSSNRYGTPPVTTSFSGTPTTVEVSQLYITAVVRTELMTITYPAIYLYNQPVNRLNTTPAWQDFHIPIVID
jgi:hypothetical protein